MTDRLNIAIVGAGIGGVSAALALSARGMNVTVFEAAESPREAGAGLSIPPNAVLLLKRTALRDDIERITDVLLVESIPVERLDERTEKI